MRDDAHLGVQETPQPQDDEAKSQAEEDEHCRQPAKSEVGGDGAGEPDQEEQQQDEEENVTGPSESPGQGCEGW